MTMPEHQWVYRATWVKVVDGDTLDLHVDMGMRIYKTERVRLLGVNAREMRGSERAQGAVDKAWVARWLADRTTPEAELEFRVETQLDERDKYGRLLARVWSVTTGECLNDAMVAQGMPAA